MRGRLTAPAIALLALPLAWPAPALADGPASAGPEIGCVEVATRAPKNPLVKVWYRVPQGYSPARRGRWRVLVLFGGRNCDGRPEVSGKLGWDSWADLNGVFLVAPTLRDDAYWDPKAWSGRALIDALDAIAARFRVSTKGLLLYGYSAGSQASNLFPAWRPDLCRAYASHACGVFHAPSARMRGVAALVTCGDADTARYVIGRRFADSCRRAGVPVVWRSFPNRPHDVPEGSVRLAKAFLAHHHWAHPEDLGGGAAPPPSVAAFVGDDADGAYYPSGSPEAAGVMPEDRVELPSEEVAAAWGVPGLRAGAPVAAARVTSGTVCGVEAVFAVPEGVRADSRILVLLGGRGWDGRRSLRELGFAEWAAGRGWCVVAPSFPAEACREPVAGAARALRRMVGTLRERHSLRPLPAFVFGYSAGGQLAALIQASPPFPVAAWGALGCGVFPEPPRGGPPALVACGVGDTARFGIGRTFACRYREAGGMLLWRPHAGGHAPDAASLALAREFFAAVADGARCAAWGEDDTRRVMPREAIDPEFLNPLFNARVAELWRRDVP